jgi:hypothetical protein
MKSRVAAWLSDENIAMAKGKTLREIFDIFGKNLEPVAIVPIHSASGGFSLALGKRRAFASLGSDTPPLGAVTTGGVGDMFPA